MDQMDSLEDVSRTDPDVIIQKIRMHLAPLAEGHEPTVKTLKLGSVHRLVHDDCQVDVGRRRTTAAVAAEGSMGSGELSDEAVEDAIIVGGNGVASNVVDDVHAGSASIFLTARTARTS